MKSLFLFALAMTYCVAEAQTTYYVKTGGNDTDAGTSWGTAFATVQHGLSAAASGDMIWVAAGTYKPSASDVNVSFQLKNGVALYGGFAGTESTLGERDWETNVTTLSGDIDNDGTLSGNTIHVIYGLLVDSTAVLDGFVITGGNSTGDGGGLYLLVAGPTLSHLLITGNNATANGGGLYNNTGSVRVRWCTFVGNSANYGGGLYNFAGGVPTIVNCVFRNNTVSSFGGGMYDGGNAISPQNLLFDGNHATQGGGALCSFASGGSPVPLVLSNITFYGNMTKYGGAIFVSGMTALTISNTIFWNDSATTSGAEIYTTSSQTATIAASLIQGGFGGTGLTGSGSYTDGGNNIDVNPVFVDSSSHDFALQGTSSAIDGGNNAAVSATTDLAGNTRVSNGTVDIGAYEYQGAPLAVTMAQFVVEAGARNAELRWQTKTEVDNYGFEIERRMVTSFEFQVPGSQLGTRDPEPGMPWSKVGFVKGSGTSSSPKEYSYADRNLPAGRYAYRIKQINNDGSFTYTSALELEISLAPRIFTLSQNYPNPFNPTTTIEFTLPEDGRVKLRIYNMLGEEVATPVDEERKAGVYQQVVFDASRLATGVYFSQLEFNGKQLIKKMMLVK